MSTSGIQPLPIAKKQAWIELLRVVAVFQVILIHTSFPILGKNELPYSDWLAANFYDSISRCSVPLFFMISGYLLLGQKESTLDFFRKRFLKVGIPALVWTVIYLILGQVAYRNGSMSLPAIGLSMLKAIYAGHVEIHLWFLFALIGLYIVMPVLRIFVSSASRMDLVYFLVIWLLANPVMNIIDKVTGETADASVRLPVVVGYVGYLVLGYALGQWHIFRRGRFMALVIFGLSFLVIFFGTSILSGQAGQGDYFLYDNLGLPVILMTASLFMLFKSFDEGAISLHPVVKRLSEASFGIYLVHILVQEILQKGWLGFRLHGWMGPAVYMIPLVSLVIFSISFVIVFAMQRVPGLKKIVP